DNKQPFRLSSNHDSSWLLRFKAFMLVTFICGCNTADVSEILPAIKPVSGTITLNGKPMEGAVISFLPMAEGGTMTVGQTREEGKYKLSYLGMLGCAPGQYQVMLSYKTTPDGKVVTLEIQSALVMPKEATQAVERMPKEYGPGNKTLTATVPPEGGEINFDLKGELLPAAESQKTDKPAVSDASTKAQPPK
ncbi:MAG: carboxypeptidase-like regulatory domain-containing protein, partial [Isosphaeraceae bacterium]